MRTNTSSSLSSSTSSSSSGTAAAAIQSSLSPPPYTVLISFKWKHCNLKRTHYIFIVYAWAHSPVGAQCPLTSSLGEFPCHWDWLWYPGIPSVLVSIAFIPFRLPYLVFPFTLHTPLDFNRVSSLRPTYLRPFD